MSVVAVPDFENAILDRLKLCFEAIRQNDEPVFRLPPVGNTVVTPCFYTVPRNMVGTVEKNTAGTLAVRRNYITTLLIAPMGSGFDNTDGEAEHLRTAVNYISQVRAYFMLNPRLQVGELGKLQHMAEDVEFQDTAIIQKAGPGGGNYFSIDFTLTIYMWAAYTRKT